MTNFHEHFGEGMQAYHDIHVIVFGNFRQLGRLEKDNEVHVIKGNRVFKEANNLLYDDKS